MGVLITQRFVIAVLALRLISISLMHATVGQMSVNFYAKKCPNMESIVRQAMKQKLRETSSSVAASGTLRLFFHDCFVDGCDGSVLLSSRGGNRAERDAPPNLSLQEDAFDVVFRAKQALERSCPGVVSCADVIAVLARDATVFARGPSWQVLKGRRDGRVSLADNANVNLPGADSTLNDLLKTFESKGLSALDMVILSGAHTIGHSHCSTLRKRLYNFSGADATDPSMERNMARRLKRICPAGAKDDDHGKAVVPFDQRSPSTFDNLYYVNLLREQGLLSSDQLLFSGGDRRIRKAVVRFARNQTAFFSAFARGMRKMGNIGTKTGNQGEIRMDCSTVN